jgi:hypothetical protein
MDAISKYHDSKIIHGWYIHAYIYFLKHCLHLNIGISFVFFVFFVLGFEAQQRRLLLQMQFDLRLSIVNYLFITMQQKL